MRVLGRILSHLLIVFYSSFSLAANYVFLMGAEDKDKPEKAYQIIAFVQPTFTNIKSDSLAAGAWRGQRAAFNSIPPGLERSSELQILRARLGVRGEVPGLRRNLDYFFLSEWGQNGITESLGPAVTDASVTYHGIPYLKVRMGQFKYPGSDEGMIPIFQYHYIAYTAVTDQLMQERFFNHLGNVSGDPNLPNGSVGAFRDVGFQLFDKFEIGNVQSTYAAMIGNGNGIGRWDSNNQKDHYLFWASEKVAGDFLWKANVWLQWGKRTFVQQEYNRQRSGLGLFGNWQRWRLGAEYIYGMGAIFAGTDGGAVPGSDDGTGSIASFNVLPDARANGYYIDVGYSWTDQWKTNLRYDLYQRATESVINHREFKTITIGLEYAYSKHIRGIFTYDFRQARAPDLPQTHAANQILASMGDRAMAQVVLFY